MTYYSSFSSSVCAIQFFATITYFYVVDALLFVALSNFSFLIMPMCYSVDSVADLSDVAVFYDFFVHSFQFYTAVTASSAVTDLISFKN